MPPTSKDKTQVLGHFVIFEAYIKLDSKIFPEGPHSLSIRAINDTNFEKCWLF